MALNKKLYKEVIVELHKEGLITETDKNFAITSEGEKELIRIDILHALKTGKRLF